MFLATFWAIFHNSSGHREPNVDQCGQTVLDIDQI
jgi:hypothetical protein